MKLFDLTFCSVKELSENRIRSILIIISIIITTVFILSFLGAGKGIKNYLFNEIEEKAIAKEIIVKSKNGLPISDAELNNYINITKPRSIRVSRQYLIDTYDGENIFTVVKPSKILVYDNNYDFITESEISAAEVKGSKEINIKYEETGVLVNEKLIIDNKIENTHNILDKKIIIGIYRNDKIEEITLPIKGIIDKNVSSSINETHNVDIYIPYSILKEKGIDGGIKTIVLDIGDYSKIDKVISKLDVGKHEISSGLDIRKAMKEEQLLYNVILSIGGVLIIGVTVMILIYTLNVSFKERLRYFGTLKALGFRSKYIFYICIIQSIIICLIGCFIGVIISTIISQYLGYYLAMGLIVNSNGATINDSFTIDSKLMILGLCLLFLTSIISGLLPAIKSALISPTDALREK
ncbi:MAG: ABC transporter permease [bacterium]